MQRVRSAALLRCRHLAGRCLRDLCDGVEPVARAAAPETAVAPRPSSASPSCSRASAASPCACSLRAAVQRALARAVAARRAAGRGSAAADQLRRARASTGRRAAATGPTRSRSGSTAGRGCSSRRSRGAAAAGTSASPSSTSAGGLHDRRIVLETPHHLSYPFVFAHDGEHLPAAGVAHLVRHDAVPRARASRTTGSRSCVLADDALYDPTLLQHDGSWWLFGTIADLGESQDDELHLFHADALERSVARASAQPGRLGRPRRAAGGAAHPRRRAPAAARAGLLRALRACGGVQGGARAEPRPPTARSRWRGSSPTGSPTTWRPTTTRPTSGGRRPTPCAAGGAGERRGPAPEAVRGSFGAGLGFGGLSFVVTTARRARLEHRDRADLRRATVGEFALRDGADAGGVVAVEPAAGSRARPRAEHAAGARPGGHRPVRRGVRGVVRPDRGGRGDPRRGQRARVPRAARPSRPAGPGAGRCWPSSCCS